MLRFNFLSVKQRYTRQNITLSCWIIVTSSLIEKQLTINNKIKLKSFQVLYLLKKVMLDNNIKTEHTLNKIPGY